MSSATGINGARGAKDIKGEDEADTYWDIAYWVLVLVYFECTKKGF